MLFYLLPLKQNCIRSIFLLLFVTILTYRTQSQTEMEKPLNETHEMKTYYLVFLKTGENRTHDPATVEQLQHQHLMHLTQLVKSGKADIVGPLLSDIDIRGIIVFNTPTQEEALQLANQDPSAGWQVKS